MKLNEFEENEIITIASKYVEVRNELNEYICCDGIGFLPNAYELMKKDEESFKDMLVRSVLKQLGYKYDYMTGYYECIED